MKDKNQNAAKLVDEFVANNGQLKQETTKKDLFSGFDKLAEVVKGFKALADQADKVMTDAGFEFSYLSANEGIVMFGEDGKVLPSLSYSFSYEPPDELSQGDIDATDAKIASLYEAFDKIDGASLSYQFGEVSQVVIYFSG